MSIEVLRRVLKRARWDTQGGYPNVRKGKFRGFVAAGLPHATPAEWDALFALAGIVPDEIVPLGACADCAHSDRGRERGYDAPCCSCERPKMSLFKLRRKKR